MRTFTRSFSLLLFYLFQFQLFCQIGLPRINENDPMLPDFVRLMYSPVPNIWDVDRAYREYEKEHEEIKENLKLVSEESETFKEEGSSPYSIYYKRWRRFVQNWTDENGNVHYPSVEDLDNEENIRKSIKENSVERGSVIWTQVGPNVHYKGKYSSGDIANMRSWHSNVYSITQCYAHPDVLYCGTESGGVYKSTDHGNNWFFVTLNEYVRDVRAIEVHPQNPDIVFFGARGKIYKSVNGGVNWAPCGQSTFLNTNIYTWDLHFNPSNPNILYAATDQGLFRSSDHGNNWTEILTQECISVVNKPNDASVIYSIQYNPVTKIGDFYKSIDSGMTFTVKPTGWFTVPPVDVGLIESKGGKIGVSEADPNKVYALLVGSSQSTANLQLNGFIGVYVSTDAGETWSNPHVTIGAPYNGTTHPNPMTFSGDNNTYNQIYYNTTIAVNQLNASEFIFGGLSLWRSTDAGASYNPVGGYVGTVPEIHPDMQELKSFKTGSGTQETWMSSDGGVNISSDFFYSHTSKSFGIGAGDFWGFDQGWNEDIMVGGKYHNGNSGYYESYPNGEFLSLGGGEASTGYVNYSNERKTYFSDIGGRVLPTDTSGVIVGFGTAQYPNEGYWLNESSRILFDADYWNIAYMGKDNIFYKSLDGGSSFVPLFTFSGSASNKVLWIEQCQSHPDVIYLQQLSGNYSKMYKSTDRGNSWNAITIPQTNKRYLFFTVSDRNPDELWVAYTNGSNGNKVYHSTNSGGSWTNISSSMLDNLEIYQITHQYGTDGGVYVAVREGGVFYRNNSMGNWVNYSSGLPVAIEPLRMVPFYKGEKMRLATKGHSIWEAPFYEPSSLSADFSADYKEFYCPGDTVYFTDHSVCTSMATYQWTFNGGVPATSNQKYPKVVYSNSGTFDVQLIVTDGSESDTVVKTMFISSTPVSSSFTHEDFESTVFPPSGWSFDDDGSDYTNWMLSSSAGGYGTSSQSAFFDNYNIDVQGKKDKLLSVKLDFSSVAAAWVTFDVAYAEYGGQYSDTLAMYVSTDCGANYSQLYIKGGQTLATAPNLTSDIFVPTSGNWRTDSVNLTNYNSQSEVIIAFENRGHWGQALYIDNINLHTISSVGNEDVSSLFYSFYPNPSDGNSFIHFSKDLDEEMMIRIVDIQGRIIAERNVPANTSLYKLNERLDSGCYFINFENQGNKSVIKWIVKN